MEPDDLTAYINSTMLDIEDLNEIVFNEFIYKLNLLDPSDHKLSGCNEIHLIEFNFVRCIYSTHISKNIGNA